MTRFLRLAAILFTIIVSHPAMADDDSEAGRQLIAQVMADTLQAYGGQNLTAGERVARLRDLIDRYGDIPVYAEDALGRYWGRASANEKIAFGRLLNQYLLGCWSSQLQDVPASLHVDLAASETLPDGRLLVHSLAVVPNDTLAVDWTVASAADGRLIIADVSIDGFSVLQTVKSDFLSILRANGGRLDVLFEALQAKIAANPPPE
ncbi:ABC transporter substrate-binding protein [Telmatospirillum sp.]|uniref:ABC transporter substrate-binding protein n=1 Tax=Telmatospirillum sp. TaxID=2079197 RepID=UPI00284331E4|nr:ABC transporter substrate-binding protein [Telmatospirillum sp.]MDR3435128.1 ABC transporter substrate-binding protein [Telmatospirillum sp.]